MGDSPLVAVLAGLGVGITLIVVFSFSFSPTIQPLSDIELIKKTNTLNDVQRFIQKYPNADITVERLERGIEVTYATEKEETNPDANQDGFSEKHLVATVDPFGGNGMALRLVCDHGAVVMEIDHPTLDDIENLCF